MKLRLRNVWLGMFFNNLAGNNLAGNNLAGNNLAGNNLAGNNLAGNLFIFLTIIHLKSP